MMPRPPSPAPSPTPHSLGNGGGGERVRGWLPGRLWSADRFQLTASLACQNSEQELGSPSAWSLSTASLLSHSRLLYTSTFPSESSHRRTQARHTPQLS